jgi:hypothetical protein
VEDHVPFAQVLAQNRRLPRKGGLLRIGAHDDDDDDDDLSENGGCCFVLGVGMVGCGGSGWRSLLSLYCHNERLFGDLLFYRML